MPPSDVAPFVIAMTVILSTAAIIILRPLTKRLGQVVESRNRERQEAGEVSGEDIARLADALNHLTDRIEALEERQDFAERLLASQPRSEARARTEDSAP